MGSGRLAGAGDRALRLFVPRGRHRHSWTLHGDGRAFARCLLGDGELLFLKTFCWDCLSITTEKHSTEHGVQRVLSIIPRHGYPFVQVP